MVFDSFEQADQHPLVQYGDVIMKSYEDIPRQWTSLELPDLISSLEMGEIDLEENWLKRHGRAVWARMLARSERPPTDPALICELITRDRKLSIKERKMADTKTSKKPKGDAPTPRKKLYAGDLKITLLADKEDKPYGKKNNPKRAGTASADRFEFYKNGMTIDQYVAAGGKYADIKNDVEHNFISVK